MPEDGGFDLAKNIRLQNADIPIIFVSEKDDIKTKRKAFLTGADDFISKPMLLEELLLRINALFRRAKIAESKEIKIGKLVLNADERSAVVEKAFSIPGLGSLYVSAIQSNDFNVVLAISFIYSLMFIFTMLLVDILYGVIDPRIRLEKGE